MQTWKASCGFECISSGESLSDLVGTGTLIQSPLGLSDSSISEHSLVTPVMTSPLIGSTSL